MFDFKMDSFLVHKSGNQKMKVKCCFVIDATGSMGPWIEAAKTQTITIIEELRKKHTNVDFEVAAVFYRDFGDREQLKIINFTSNTVSFSLDINSVKAYGGDDTCEDVAGGLNAAVELDWEDAEVKNMFLIADAPPHGRGWHSISVSDRFPNNDYNIERHLQTIVDKGIQLSIIKASECIDMMIVRMSVICRNLVVSDLVSHNLFEPEYHYLYEGCPGGSLMTPEAVAFNRSVSSQVEDSIRSVTSQSEH